MKINKLKSIGVKFAFALIISIASQVKQVNAQLTGFHAVYFQDQYLSNPAMAGITRGLNVELGYQQQWISNPGAPKLQSLTADYNSGDNVGLGLIINNDKAGLISRTRVMGTYAYHLPLSAGSKLSFGLSLGVNDSYIDYSKIVGDQGDVEAQYFNQRSAYVDGDFGIAYASSKLTLQAAMPNLKNVFFTNNDQRLDVDRSTFYSAASYRFDFENGSGEYSIEPKIAYRGIKSFNNILDAGANFALKDDNISFSGMYHSNRSFTLGLGLNLQAMDLLIAYTDNVGPLATYANNTFELGIKLKLFR